MIKKFKIQAKGFPFGENSKFKIFPIVLIIFLFLSFMPQTAEAAVSSQAVFNLTNSSRIENGLTPLTSNFQLAQAANLKAQDMLNKNYFAHTSPDGLNSWYWFRLVGYNYKTAGENLAIDFSDSSRVFNAWMASPTHRANILDPDFSEIGIAVLTGEFSGSNTTVIVQMFGTKLNSPNISHPSVYGSSHNSNSKPALFEFLDEFVNKFKSLWSDTSSDLKRILVRKTLLVLVK